MRASRGLKWENKMYKRKRSIEYFAIRYGSFFLSALNQVLSNEFMKVQLPQTVKRYIMILRVNPSSEVNLCFIPPLRHCIWEGFS